MELGEKILRCRRALGLSQRQLCGDTITRNMLSQIEHGTAKPSMATLQILAQRLGKPISYFLEEEADTESLDVLGKLRKAEEALAAGKHRLAQRLLETVETEASELQRKKQLLLAKIPGADLEEICKNLPSLDDELLLRAAAAGNRGDWARCQALLAAVENQNDPKWQLLRGEIFFREKNWQAAADCFVLAEGDFTAEAVPKLEICYRELGDFKRAYEYACRQK